MPTPDEMRATLELYLERVGRGDVEGVVALFADDVSVEDPVGGPPGTHVVGRERVLRFFRKGFARSRPVPRPTGAIRTTGADQAAMPFVLELDLGGTRSEVDVIDVVRFDATGRITALRAFWNPDDARPAPSPG
jgi:steroid delta-isomerase